MDMLLLDGKRMDMKRSKAVFGIITVTMSIVGRVCVLTRPLLLLLILPAVVEAQSYTNNYGIWTYSTDNGTITITGYTGPGGAVIIPGEINGLPVTTIGGAAFFNCRSLTSMTISDSVTAIWSGAFNNCTSLSSVTIGDGVTNIGIEAFGACSSLTTVTIGNGLSSLGEWAFSGCSSLTNVFFQGNAPSYAYQGVFDLPNPNGAYYPPYWDPATIFYLPGTTGWGTNFAGLPTALWNPQVQTSGTSFGVQTNQFGFNITGTSNMVVAVEATTNLVNPVWSPVQTITLTGGPFYFSDPQWTGYGSRFYRLTMP
jgi:hypothetical protein